MYCKPTDKPNIVGMVAVIVTGVALAVGMAHLPEELWYTMPTIGLVLTIATRLPQIYTNFSNGHTGVAAGLTWFLNLAGALARVFTTMSVRLYSDSSAHTCILRPPLNPHNNTVCILTYGAARTLEFRRNPDLFFSLAFLSELVSASSSWPRFYSIGLPLPRLWRKRLQKRRSKPH